MKQLDLHGITHANVHKELDGFFGVANFPVVIITGQSRRMKELVAQIALGYGLKTKDTLANPGRVVVYE